MFEFITRIKEINELRQKNFDLKCENYALVTNQAKDTIAMIAAADKIRSLNLDLERYDKIIFDYSEKHPFGDETYFDRKEDK